MGARNPRNIGELTWIEVRGLDKRHGALVLPLGAIEQHGPHLSTDCDLHIADRFLDLALQRLPEHVPMWRLPAMAVTKSNEHVGFPGTFWLSSQTMTAVVMDIARSARASGFRRFVLWNSHGGNSALLEVIARDVHIETGLMTFKIGAPGIAPDPLEPLNPHEARHGIHAGEWETSIMLALSPDRVRLDRLDKAFPELESDLIALEAAPATIGWATRDFQSTGTWGDATGASAERGQARLDPLIDALSRVLAEIATFEMSSS